MCSSHWSQRAEKATRGRSVSTNGRSVAVRLRRAQSIEVAYLTAACIYALTLPLKSTLTLIDSVVLVAIFVGYIIRLSRMPTEVPELIGPAALVGDLPTARRHAAEIGMFVFTAVVILLCAEPFSEGLVEGGKEIGIDQFLLVQWIAPLASETPELLAAGLFAWNLKGNEGLTAVVSSKVNQWTLLVGLIPVIFAISAGGLSGLPVDPVQRQELFLTAAQSIFAVALIADLSLDRRDAVDHLPRRVRPRCPSSSGLRRLGPNGHRGPLSGAGRGRHHRPPARGAEAAARRIPDTLGESSPRQPEDQTHRIAGALSSTRVGWAAKPPTP